MLKKRLMRCTQDIRGKQGWRQSKRLFKSDGPVRRRTTVRRLQRTTRSLSARAEKFAERKANITNEGTCTAKTVRWTGTCSHESEAADSDIYDKMADFDVVFVQMDNDDLM